MKMMKILKMFLISSYIIGLFLLTSNTKNHEKKYPTCCTASERCSYTTTSSRKEEEARLPSPPSIRVCRECMEDSRLPNPRGSLTPLAKSRVAQTRSANPRLSG